MEGSDVHLLLIARTKIALTDGDKALRIKSTFPGAVKLRVSHLQEASFGRISDLTIHFRPHEMSIRIRAGDLKGSLPRDLCRLRRLTSLVADVAAHLSETINALAKIEGADDGKEVKPVQVSSEKGGAKASFTILATCTERLGLDLDVISATLSQDASLAYIPSRRELRVDIPSEAQANISGQLFCHLKGSTSLMLCEELTQIRTSNVDIWPTPENIHVLSSFKLPASAQSTGVTFRDAAQTKSGMSVTAERKAKWRLEGSRISLLTKFMAWTASKLEMEGQVRKTHYALTLCCACVVA